MSPGANISPSWSGNFLIYTSLQLDGEGVEYLIAREKVRWCGGHLPHAVRLFLNENGVWQYE